MCSIGRRIRTTEYAKSYHQIKLSSFDKCNKLRELFARHQVASMVFQNILNGINMGTLLSEWGAAPT